MPLRVWWVRRTIGGNRNTLEASTQPASDASTHPTGESRNYWLGTNRSEIELMQ